MKLTVYDQEILLQTLWKSRKFVSQTLKTSTDRNVEVIFAGRDNPDTGPDFKDAVLKLDGALVRGDVEAHWQENGWYAHGHHRDSRYNNVVLHIVCTPPRQPYIVREDGVKVEQLFFELDLEAGPVRNSCGEDGVDSTEAAIVENCPLSRESVARISMTLASAGECRFRRKLDQLREELRIDTWDQVLYRRIMESLGYSKNRIPFRKLADSIPFDLVHSEMQWVSPEMAEQKCAGLLFGAAGLLPESSEINKQSQDSDGYVKGLQQTWRRLSHRLDLRPMTSNEWQFFRLRPQNFPTRRLAGGVQILVRLQGQGILGSLIGLFQAWVDHPKLLPKELDKLFLVHASGFWCTHYRFEYPTDTLHDADIALVGRERSRDIVFNTILPAVYLYGEESNDGKLLNVLKEVLNIYPRLAENTITRAMRKQLFRSGNRALLKSAMTQQGLIHLHKSYCRELLCTQCQKLGTVPEKNVTGL